MRSWRAGLPTVISPAGETETMLGTSLAPSSPGMTRGAPESMMATRLLVVPRSMPTMWSEEPKSICSTMGLHLFYKIADVLAAVQEGADFRMRVRGEGLLELTVDIRAHVEEFLEEVRELRFVAFFERHVQFEHFFQEFGGHFFVRGAYDVFGAADGVFQGAVGVVQERRVVEGFLFFRIAFAREEIGVPLAAELVVALFEILRVQV